MAFPLVLQNVQLSKFCIPLFVPDASVVKEAYQKGETAFPYWSQVWPAAKALAEFILSYPDYSEGKKVVELGAGLGLPSLVAARNATSVLCTDSEPEAVKVAKKSAAYLELKNFTAEVMDWERLRPNLKTDVLLLSDVSYNPATFPPLLKAIEAFLQKGTIALLSTPQRLVAKEFVILLTQYCIDQKETVVAHEGNEVPTTVLVLQLA